MLATRVRARARRLSPRQRVLRTFALDGILISLSDSLASPYIVLFALTLGASASQVGYLASVGHLLAALTMLPGARLVERFGRRRVIVAGIGRMGGALVFLCLAAMPWLTSGTRAVAALLGLYALRALLTNLASPAWASLAASLVPPSIRGRYFSFRNMAKGVAALLAIPLAGQIVTRMGAPQGYQIIFVLAGLSGLAGAWVYSRLPDPRGRERSVPLRLPRWDNLRQERPYLGFCAASALLHFSVQLVGPYFNVHMVRNLGLTAATIGLLATIAPIASLGGQRIFGTYTDRAGNRPAMALTGLIIAVVPWLWIPVGAAWQIAPINAIAGVVWAGYELAAFNLLLLLSPEGSRSRRVAFYYTAVALAAAVGPLAGGWVFEALGFPWAAFLSGLGRLGAVLLFLLLVSEPLLTRRP